MCLNVPPAQPVGFSRKLEDARVASPGAEATVRGQREGHGNATRSPKQQVGVLLCLQFGGYLSPWVPGGPLGSRGKACAGWSSQALWQHPHPMGTGPSPAGKLQLWVDSSQPLAEPCAFFFLKCFPLMGHLEMHFARGAGNRSS